MKKKKQPPAPPAPVSAPAMGAGHLTLVLPRPGAPVRVICASSRVLTLWTHWYAHPGLNGGGRTVLHATRSRPCLWCAALDQRPRWRGYLGAWQPVSNRPVVVEITTSAVAGCAYLDPVKGIDLFARELILRRTGKSHNSPVAAELGGVLPDKAQWPSPVDAWPTLCLLFEKAGRDVEGLSVKEGPPEQQGGPELT